jgi:hypothetical protein
LFLVHQRNIETSQAQKQVQKVIQKQLEEAEKFDLAQKLEKAKRQQALQQRLKMRNKPKQAATENA